MEARGSRVEIVCVPDHIDARRRRAVGEPALEIQEAVGFEPVVAEAPGHVAHRIVDAAEAAKSTLIVLGRRGVKEVNGARKHQRTGRSSCAVLGSPRAPRHPRMSMTRAAVVSQCVRSYPGRRSATRTDDGEGSSGHDSGRVRKE